MRTFKHAIALFAVTAVLGSCTESQTTAPLSADASLDASRSDRDESGVRARDGDRTVYLLDRCDPATFNAALGAGTCIGERKGITFQQFMSQLERIHTVPQWRFSPLNLEIKLGETFLAKNLGGETHTFTEVEEFGGGIVPSLNALAGVPEVAPECKALLPADFLAPGASHPDTPDEAGTEKYQCCIHPWMRSTVRVRESKGESHAHGGAEGR